MLSGSLENMSPEAIADLAAMAANLANDPKTRNRFLQLAKVNNPDLSIPEVDIPLHVNSLLKDSNEKIASLEAKLSEKEMREKVLDKRKEALKFVSESDLPEVEKLMLERGIADHKTAAEFFKLQKQTAIPTPSSTHAGFTMPKIDVKDFGGNINAWARQEAAKTIDDLKAGRI